MAAESTFGLGQNHYGIDVNASIQESDLNNREQTFGKALDESIANETGLVANGRPVLFDLEHTPSIKKSKQEFTIKNSKPETLSLAEKKLLSVKLKEANEKLRE